MRKTTLSFMVLLAISFMGCNKEKLITLSTTSTTLHHGETYQINAQCDNPMTFSTANEYYAKVSSTGLITAQYVGSTTIRINSEDDNKSFNVTVSPISNLYQEPNIKFGDSKTTVISKLGNPDTTSDDSFGYNNYSNAAQMLIVTFDNNDRVEYYGLIVKSSYSSELGTFLKERYDFVTYSDEIFLYRNGLTENTTTKYIGMKLYNINYWMVIYMSADNMKSSIDMDISKLLKAIEKN